MEHFPIGYGADTNCARAAERRKARSRKAGLRFEDYAERNCCLAMTAPAAVGTTTAAAVTEAGGVFRGWFVAGVAYMALAIPRLVGLKVGEGLRPTIRHWASVTVMWIVAVIDVAIEAVRAVEPGASSNEYSAGKPVRPIVAVGSAGIGCVVEVAIRAYRRDADADGDLSMSRRY